MVLTLNQSNFQTLIKDSHQEYLLQICSHENATRPHWRLINICAGNGIASWDDKPLPEPILTHISGTLSSPQIIMSFHFAFLILIISS